MNIIINSYTYLRRKGKVVRINHHSSVLFPISLSHIFFLWPVIWLLNKFSTQVYICQLDVCAEDGRLFLNGLVNEWFRSLDALNCWKIEVSVNYSWVTIISIAHLLSHSINCWRKSLFWHVKNGNFFVG